MTPVACLAVLSKLRRCTGAVLRFDYDVGSTMRTEPSLGDRPDAGSS